MYPPPSLPTLLPPRYFLALAWVLGAISFLKAVRLPNRWAATNFVLNYSQGFVRRGLMGEVARRLLGDAAFHYRVFVVFAFLVMGAAGWALVWLGRRALRTREEGGLELQTPILVFLASPALVLLVHMVGYLDHLGLLFVGLFAAAAAAVERDGLRYGWAAAGVAVLALVHEAQTVLFVPTVLFVLACRALGAAQRPPLGGRSRPAWHTALALAGVLAVALGVSAYVSLAGQAQRAAALDRWLAQRADFTLHYGVFRALKTQTPVSLLDTMRDYWAQPEQQLWGLRTLALFLPSSIFLGVCAWQAIGRADSASRRAVAALRGLFLVACLSPLSLNVVAWDYARWFAVAVTNALVCLLAVHVCCRVAPRRKEGRSHERGAPLALAGAVVIALGLASDAILFNNAQISYYPFFSQWEALSGLLQSGSIPSPK